MHVIPSEAEGSPYAGTSPRPVHVIPSEAEGSPYAGTSPRPVHVIPSEAEGSPYTGTSPRPVHVIPSEAEGSPYAGTSPRPVHVIPSEVEGSPYAGTSPRPVHVIPSEAEGSPYTGTSPRPVHVIPSEVEGSPYAGTSPRPVHVIPSEVEGSPDTGTSNQKEIFSLATDFERLEILPWKNIPGITGLSGHLTMNTLSGQLLLKGKDLVLDFAGLFSVPLAFEQYAANIDWIETENDWQIRVNDFNINDSVLNLSGNMNLFLSHDKEISPFVALNLAFTEKNPQYLHKYVPAGILPQGLMTWLNEAFTGPGNITGQFLLHGPLDKFPFDQQEGRFEMIASIENTPLNYKTGWPAFNNFSANVLLDGRRLIIDSDEAEIFSTKVKNIYAEIPDLAKSGLIVEGGINANSATGMEFIFKSPLNATLGQKFKALQLSGPIQLDLKLAIPFHDENPPLSINGHIDFLSTAKLALPSWGIFLEDVTGTFDFTENALSTDKIAAKWLGHPLLINITTDHPAVNESIIRVKVKGDMSIQDIEKAYSLNTLNEIISGATNYEIMLDFINKKGKENTIFSMNSDLEGIAIQLPPPLRKNASDKIPTYAKISFNEQGTRFFDLTGNYGKILSTALRFSANPSSATQKEHWSLTRGEIRFGAQPATLGNAPGLRIKGGLSTLSLSDIKPWISSFSAKENKQKPFFTIDQVDLNIGKLDLFGFTLQPINIKVKPEKSGWRIAIENPDIAGWFILPGGNSSPLIEGQFNRFYVTLDERSNQQLTSLNPGDIPSLNILLNDFRYDQRIFGRLFFITSREQNTMRINRLVLSSPYSVMNATGFWQKLPNGKMQTHLNGEFRSSNLGKVLRALRVTESLEETKGRATFALSWPSEIYHPDFGHLNGQFSFDFQNGRIINMSESSEAEMGLGRLLNLLSLQSLPRRLTLDFSDIGAKGFGFDVMKGDFVLNHGSAMTNNTYLDGPIAKVELKGDININKKIYNLSMLVTPYVTASIPLLVATIAGSPVAGAAAWVAHKVFGGVVNSISSTLYKVTGPWDAPNVGKSSE